MTVSNLTNHSYAFDPEGIMLRILSMMSDQLRTYRAYASFVKRLLLFGGLLPETKERNIVYSQLAILSIVSNIVFLYAVLNFSFQNIANLSLLTKSLGIAGSTIAVILKATLFHVHRKELRQVNKILDCLFEDALKEPRLRPILLSLLRFFYRPAHVVTFSALFIVLLYIGKPLIVIVIHFVKGEKLEHYTLPYPASYPWLTDNSIVLYQLHYFFEIEVSWFICCVTTGADTVFGFYTFRISALLRVIAFEFKTLQPRNNTRRAIFRKCVVTHAQLLKCRDSIQKIYGPIVLLMALTNALMMCTMIFQAFQSGRMTVDKAMLFGVYLFLKLSQTFMYAWCGHIVTAEPNRDKLHVFGAQSEILGREVYCSTWYEAATDHSYTKGILFVITQRPISFTACRFFKISLDFFIRIVNTTISYFFLLQTLDDKDE